MTDDWINTTIGEQATLQRGIDITKIEQRDGSVPVVSSGGISSYHDTVGARGPGVVLGRKGVVGTVWFLPIDHWPHDTTLWVKDFHHNSPRFVYYFFKWMAPRLARMDVGSANPTLNRNHVHPIEIRWPPPSEQRAIAHILGALDDKIELNRRMSETLEAMAQALFKSWFVSFEPVRGKTVGRDASLPGPIADLFPDGLIASELGDIPEGWRVGSILNQAALLSGGTPKTDVPAYWGGAIRWASAKDVSQCREAFLMATERTITTRGLEESATQIIPALSTVVVARGATTGRMTLLSRDMAMNQTCYAVATTTGTPFALYCRLRHEIDGLVHAAHGSVFDTITTKTFSLAKVVVVPEALLKTFETLVEPFFQRIRGAAAESLTLAAIRDSLLPKLISGELRLKNTERFVQEAVA